MSRRPLSVPLALSLAVSAVAVAHLADPALADAAEPKPRPPWLQEKHILEVGLYMGALFPAADHGLYEEKVAMSPRPLKTGFSGGLRIAYMPLRFVGIEAEGGISPSKVVYDLDGEEAKRKVLLYALRAHVILQLPTQLSLFVLAGGGVLGASSKDDALGKSADGTLHFGGGLKYYVHKKVVLRIDGRDIVGPAYTKGMGGPDWTHHGEFTFGASFVLGRQSTKMLKRG
jgi:OOP family OmpA-OmpF porin